MSENTHDETATRRDAERATAEQVEERPSRGARAATALTRTAVVKYAGRTIPGLYLIVTGVRSMIDVVLGRKSADHAAASSGASLLAGTIGAAATAAAVGTGPVGWVVGVFVVTAAAGAATWAVDQLYARPTTDADRLRSA